MSWTVRALVVCLTLVSMATGLTASATGASTGTSPTSISGYIGYFASSTSYTITRPASVTISANFQPTSGTSEVSLELWARPWGSSWKLLDSLTSDNTGAAHRLVSPTHNTLYQWRFTGNDQQAPSESQLLTIRVRVKVTLSLNDSSLRVGQTLVARGVTRPIKPGLTATLWRVAPSGTTKLASRTIRSDGSYRITKVFSHRGGSSLMVTVPGATGNLKGTSPLRAVDVG